MPIQPLAIRTSLFTPVNGRQMSAPELKAYRLGMLYAVWFLAKLDELERTLDPGLPKIYASGLRYHHRWDWENWPDIRQALSDGEACCKALTAARLAELWGEGIDARPFLSWTVIPSGKYQGLTMYHYRVWRPLATLGTDPPPILETPHGDVIVEGPPGDNGEPGVIECPSAELGLYWESAFATTDRRPASAAFQARVAQIMGRPARTWSNPTVQPAAAAGALAVPQSRIRAAVDGLLSTGDIQIPPNWVPLIAAGNETAVRAWRDLCDRARAGNTRAAMTVEMVPAMYRASSQTAGYDRGQV